MFRLMMVIFAINIILISCSTPEFKQMKRSCKSIWLDKMPPNYIQENYMRSLTRQVPDGTVSCMSYGSNYQFTDCKQGMKTEYYSVPAVRTVDTNLSKRNFEINSCTRNNCIRKFGNANCEN